MDLISLQNLTTLQKRRHYVRWIRSAMLMVAALGLMVGCGDSGEVIDNDASDDKDGSVIADCDEGATRELTCGLNLRGKQAQICLDGGWADDGACADPDECVEAATRDVPCGIDDEGTQAQRCEAGGWLNVGVCEESKECEEGDTAILECEEGDLGVREQSCVDGSWQIGACEALAISAGGTHTCALRTNGQLICWGGNGSGELGDGTTFNSGKPVPVDESLNDVVDVSAGIGAHTCAVRSNGQVYCWGSAEYGKLGNGESEGTFGPAPVTGLNDAIAVSAGLSHTCALRANGHIACWGRGGRAGHADDQLTPRAISGITDGIAVSAGNNHTCAVRRTGEVRCWGIGTAGQLGNGETENSVNPVIVQTLSEVVAIASGNAHSCAVRQNGSAACWGAGAGGQLGNAATNSQSRPVNVVTLTDFIDIGAGLARTCGLRSNGHVACWGSPGLGGGLGDGSSNTVSSVPVNVVDLTDATSITVGGLLLINYACATRANGKAVCWGYGALGTEDSTNATLTSLRPADVLWPPEP